MPDARSRPRAVDPDTFTALPDWAQRLHLARIERGWRLRDLAEATGLDVTRLSEYEHGQHRPGPHWAPILHAALGIEP